MYLKALDKDGQAKKSGIYYPKTSLRDSGNKKAAIQAAF